MNNGDIPVVMCFVANLYFSTRIESVLHDLGYECNLIESGDQIGPLDNSPVARQLTEPLEGVGAVLVEKITLWQPVMIIFDLDNSDVPWRDWIAILKSASATRRVPIICFGSHKDKQGILIANQAGADGVFARSRFFNDLQTLIKKFARTYDDNLLTAVCRERLSEMAIKGLNEFNNRNYYEAHEYLEDAWNDDRTIGRELYRAILQVAVAYLQIERGNYRGAKKMLLRVHQWIDPLPPSCRGVNVLELRENAYKVQDALSKLETNKLSQLNHELMRPIQFSVSTIE